MLRPITVQDGYISWVDAPPELDVQDTLRSLLQEQAKLKKDLGDTKVRLAAAEDAVKALQRYKPKVITTPTTTPIQQPVASTSAAATSSGVIVRPNGYKGKLPYQPNNQKRKAENEAKIEKE
jgi:hypothetical protein